MFAENWDKTDRRGALREALRGVAEPRRRVRVRRGQGASTRSACRCSRTRSQLKKPSRAAHRPVDRACSPGLDAGSHRQGDVLRLRQARTTRGSSSTTSTGRTCSPSPSTSLPVKVYDALDYRLYDWPGHGVGRGLGLPVQRGRVHEGRRVRQAHRRPVQLLAALLPAARDRRHASRGPRSTPSPTWSRAPWSGRSSSRSARRPCRTC